VIIVGGGMAGLFAALAAGEAGADVLVLESEPAVGGSMALSGGLIWGPATFADSTPWAAAELRRELQPALVDIDGGDRVGEVAATNCTARWPSPPTPMTSAAAALLGSIASLAGLAALLGAWALRVTLHRTARCASSTLAG
jgi:glycine/D-amino acid oxidase-like deaminating enzyme